MQHHINNFVDNNPIEVESADYSGPGGGDKLVRIVQWSGSMHFQHDMTITQARALADALLACCEELE